MNSVDRVKALCKERKIPISKLENDLGFANGYVGQLKKGSFPDDRLLEIANYLDVSPTYLLSGAEAGNQDYYLNDYTRELAQFAFENPNYKVLFDASRKTTPEDFELILKMMERVNGDE